jgi:hypothetical protein
MDEVTNRMRNVRGGDPEWINRLLMDITVGKGKERLEATSISERKNITTWATIALLSSNTSIIDALGSRAYTTQGEMLRLLEVEMHDKLDMNIEETALLGTLNSNYGVVGLRYIMWLVQNKKKAKETFLRVKEEFIKRGRFTSDERFWLNGVSAMLTGGILAGGAGAKLVDLPMAKITDFAANLIYSSRATVKEAQQDAVALFVSYIQQNYGKFLILRKEANETRARLGLDEITDETLSRNEIKGRVEIGFQLGVVSLFLDKKELSSFCSAVNYSASMMRRQLQTAGFTVVDTRKCMLANTRVALNVYTKVLAVSMSEERFRDDFANAPIDAPGPASA